MEKFRHRRFLVVGSQREELARQFSTANAEAAAFASVAEVPRAFSEKKAELAIWFYPRENAADEQAVPLLAAASHDVLLIPEPGADASVRRPELVRRFGEVGLFPDYECDLESVDPAALCLVRAAPPSTEALVPAVESAFARAQRQLRALERSLRTRMAELEAADRHISTLEEKLLKLKEAKQHIKLLKAEKQALRKSAERKVGQVVLAPYLLPQRLVRGIRKRLPQKKSKAPKPANEYQAWFEAHRTRPAELGRLREEARAFDYQPCVSIITPVFNTPLPWLQQCAQSVLDQVYEKWELILVDDNSDDPELAKFLPELAARDSRFVLSRIEKRGGISGASNRGLELAQGEWIGFLDHDDILEPDAVFQHVKWLQTHRDADLIYSDEDKLTEEGLDAPIFKPDWSPDYFLSCNYICHFTLIRASVLAQVGGFRSEFDGAQDYDLFLRIIERTKRIDHVPRILYHWRRSRASTADNIRRKPGSLETGRLALEAHLARQSIPGHVTVDWRTHAYWIKRDLPDPQPISIIIPVRDRVDLLARCLDSITRETSYAPY
ncbi:MAG TPA: glycosyltransferase, partial [Chthoniobacterales bacterium]